MAQVTIDNLTCQLCGGGSDNNDRLPDLVPITRLTSYLSHQNVLEDFLPVGVDSPSQLTDENAPKLWFKLLTSSNDLTENSDSEHFLLCDNCSSQLQTVENLTTELESIQKRIECQVLKINEIRQGSTTLTVSPGQVTISGWTSGQDNIWRGWEALGSILEGTLPRLTGSGVENGGESSTEMVLEETGNQSQEPEQQELSLFCEVDEDYMPVIKTDNDVNNSTVENCQGHSSTGKDNSEATEEGEHLNNLSPPEDDVSSRTRRKRKSTEPAPLSVKNRRRRTMVAEPEVTKRVLTVTLERLQLPLQNKLPAEESKSSEAPPEDDADFVPSEGLTEKDNDSEEPRKQAIKATEKCQVPKKKRKKKVSQKESKDYKCPHCDTTIKGYSHFGAHLFQQHLDLRPHVCDICNWPFTTRRILQDHKVIHSEERRFQCELCGASFKRSFAFQKHMKIMHGIKVPVKTKVKSLPGIKTFKCPYCDFSVEGKMKSELALHYREKHADKRPHPCPVCEYPFPSLWDLKQHELLHSEETPFKCELCQAGFKIKVYLNRHTAKMHSRKSNDNIDKESV